MTRPSWDSYFIQMAQLTASRSNCIRRKVGAIVVKDHRILSVGYNGTPRGMLNCTEGGCPRCAQTTLAIGNQLDLCMCLHAEDNALLFVSKEELQGATLYLTLCPCVSCAKKILQCQIARVVYVDSYQDDLDVMTLLMLHNHKVVVEKFEQAS